MCTHNECWRTESLREEYGYDHNLRDHSTFCPTSCETCIQNSRRPRCFFCKTRYARPIRTTANEICKKCLERYGLRIANDED